MADLDRGVEFRLEMAGEGGLVAEGLFQKLKLSHLAPCHFRLYDGLLFIHLARLEQHFGRWWQSE